MVWICVLTFIASCAGRKATPVAVSEYNDDLKSCQQLATELTMIDQDIGRLKKESDKTYQDAFFGAAAIFLYVPALFIDFGNAEREEIAGEEQRRQHLLIIAYDKNCNFGVKPDAVPSPAAKPAS